MTRTEEIAAALRVVREQIAAAEARAQRPAGRVRLIAVSKKMPADDIRAALDAGQLDFGENYATELRDKRAALGSEDGPYETSPPMGAVPATRPRWHYLGPLQRNKVKYLAGQVALIHSVSDVETLHEIDRRILASASARAGTTSGEATQACLVQVNVAGEAQKSGAAPAALPALLDAFAAVTHARCVGLMLIPPLAPDPEASRPHFAALRALAEREARTQRPHVDLRELSMGMSGDFTVAIEEGATLVRVGTAIFGERTSA